MFDRLFRDHPRQVGESYPEHARVAAAFGAELIRGGLACFVHAIVPALCTRTGSDTVRRLHARMTTRQPRALMTPESAERAGPWQITYEI